MPFMKAATVSWTWKDYEDYEGAEEDLDYEESEYTDSVIPNEERKLRKSKCCNPSPPVLSPE